MSVFLCINCGSKDQKFLLTSKDRVYNVGGLFNVVECLDCKLVFISPQPTPKDLEKHYPPEYGPYQDNIEDFKYGPISKFYKKFFQKKYINSLPAKIDNDSELNYLDFGCGDGKHLLRVKAEHPKWSLFGLDNNLFACQKAQEKGFRIFCGNIFNLDLPQDFFDVVNMSHVIEHVHDPKKTLFKINSLMKVDSKLIIITPNFDSLVAKVFKSYWYALDLPRHLFLFTPETISNLLSNTGFEIYKIKFDRSPKVGIKSLYYLLGKKDLRINPFIWRILLPISYVLSYRGKTSTMTIYAHKKETL